MFTDVDFFGAAAAVWFRFHRLLFFLLCPGLRIVGVDLSFVCTSVLGPGNFGFLGFGVLGLGFWVWGSGFGVLGLGVLGLGFWVWGSGIRVLGPQKRPRVQIWRRTLQTKEFLVLKSAPFWALKNLDFWIHI